MGSSEFYRAVELDGRAQDSLVLEVDTPGQAGYLMLFVVLRQGELNAELEAELRRKLREQLSPRHVPDAIIEVRDIPYTQSGKKLEIPIKRILSGVPFERAVNLGALRNPQALIELVSIANRHLDSTRSPAQAR